MVTTQAHFLRTSDGVIRSDTGGRSYEFWNRYRNVFEEVVIIARVSDSEQSEGMGVEGQGVSVAPIEGYRGLLGILKNYWSLRRDMTKVARYSQTSFIIRGPSVIGGVLASRLRRRDVPYGIEVVGDPYDVFSTPVVHPVIDRVIRTYATWSLRRIVRGADAASYVTAKRLQRRYPAQEAAFVTHYSSVQLSEEAFVTVPPQRQIDGRMVVAVGSHSQMYKGHDVLIRAAASLKESGRPIRVRLVGDGKFRVDLERLASSLGVGEETEFLGMLPSGEAVRSVLDSADIFAMPSRTEGLPRALIEAMARGLPSVGTTVGAIPELLEESELVEPDEAEVLAEVVDSLLSDHARRRGLALKNLEIARLYSDARLAERRDAFYSAVRSSNGRRLRRSRIG